MSRDWSHVKAKHRPCACGCGELADECMSGRGDPLAAFTISPPVGSTTVAGCPICRGDMPAHQAGHPIQAAHREHHREHHRDGTDEPTP